ncbi:MAG: hypothetical protein H0T57_04260 [Rubrobacter sp.]|nr:hypothetical protein [Rubrobacter sp.]
MGLGDPDVLMVTGGKSAGDPGQLIDNGAEVDLNSVGVAYQEERECGITEALLLAGYFTDSEPVCVVLGNDLFEKGVEEAVEGFEGGACLLLEDGTRYRKRQWTGTGGRPDTEDRRELWNLRAPTRWLECAPTTAGSPTSSSSWGFSVRGNLEVTYVTTPESGGMSYGIFDGRWTEAGTFGSLLWTSRPVAGRPEDRNGKVES